MRNLIRVFILKAIFLNLATTCAFADHLNKSWRGARAGGHAPIGVMADHTHNEGEWMLSYRHMYMDMSGNREGTNGVSTQEVLQDFMVSPTSMDMQMHMLGAMIAPSDFYTLMIMVPFVDISMDHTTRSGANFSTQASGLGDISFTGLFKVYDENMQRIHFNAGVSLPSGEIDERDATPMGPESPLPYPMQLGSGTVDLRPGVTYLGQADKVGWGSQVLGTIRLGENDNNYTLGNSLDATMWLSYDWCNSLSNSIRLAYRSLGNIDGADPRLNPMVVPTARTDLRGGDRLDIGLGVNLYVPQGSMKDFRLAVEVLMPLYQDLDGPQLETDLQVVTGIQYSF